MTQLFDARGCAAFCLRNRGRCCVLEPCLESPLNRIYSHVKSCECDVGEMRFLHWLLRCFFGDVLICHVFLGGGVELMSKKRVQLCFQEASSKKVLREYGVLKDFV